MGNKIAENMKLMARYEKIIQIAYVGDDKERLKELSREMKLLTAELFKNLNEKLYSEIRKDLMTLGVGCISLFEDNYSREIEESDCWNETRNQIFDRINKILSKYEELLLK